MIIDVIITVDIDTTDQDIEDMRKEILQLAKNQIDELPHTPILEPVEL